MTPFEYLGKEHRELTQVLGVLESMTRAVAAGEPVDRHKLGVIVDYFREVGDMAHHDKEETILVPALVRHHMDWFDGPLAEMRREHRQERYLMRHLRHSATKTQDWSEEDRRHFVSIASAYSEFLRAHQAKESQRWFPEAERLLPEEEQQAIVESFRRLDEDLEKIEDYAAIRQRALELVAQANG